MHWGSIAFMCWFWGSGLWSLCMNKWQTNWRTDRIRPAQCLGASSFTITWRVRERNEKVWQLQKSKLLSSECLGCKKKKQKRKTENMQKWNMHVWIALHSKWIAREIRQQTTEWYAVCAIWCCIASRAQTRKKGQINQKCAFSFIHSHLYISSLHLSPTRIAQTVSERKKWVCLDLIELLISWQNIWKEYLHFIRTGSLSASPGTFYFIQNQSTLYYTLNGLQWSLRGISVLTTGCHHAVSLQRKAAMRWKRLRVAALIRFSTHAVGLEFGIRVPIRFLRNKNFISYTPRSRV